MLWIVVRASDDGADRAELVTRGQDAPQHVGYINSTHMPLVGRCVMADTSHWAASIGLRYLTDAE